MIYFTIYIFLVKLKQRYYKMKQLVKGMSDTPFLESAISFEAQQLFLHFEPQIALIQFLFLGQIWCSSCFVR